MLIPSFRFPHTLFSLIHSAAPAARSLNFSVARKAKLRAQAEKVNEKRKGSYDPATETASVNLPETRSCQHTDTHTETETEKSFKENVTG